MFPGCKSRRNNESERENKRTKEPTRERLAIIENRQATSAGLSVFSHSMPCPATAVPVKRLWCVDGQNEQRGVVLIPVKYLSVCCCRLSPQYWGFGFL